MIRVDPATALLLYLTATLVALGWIWGRSYWVRRQRDWLLPEACLYRCEFCDYVYLDKREANVTACPQCQSYNKDNRYQADTDVAEVEP
jgi:ribosomal protein L37AE/L43A